MDSRGQDEQQKSGWPAVIRLTSRGQARQQTLGRTGEIRQDSRGLVGLERPTWPAEVKDDHERSGRRAKV